MSVYKYRLTWALHIIALLVMFGSRLQFNASSLAARILRYSCNYATILGVVTFRVQCHRNNDRLVAHNRHWFKCISMMVRILTFYLYCQTYSSFINVLQIAHLKMLICVRMFCSFICAVVILVMQFWNGDQVISMVNSFLRLYRRVNLLPGCQDMCYGGKREIILLLFGVLCQFYQCCYLIPALFIDFEINFAFTILFETYCSICAALISHICFVGYLSVGALYDQVNRYVQQELRSQLTGLKPTASRRRLKAAGYRLDECLAIYDEIQRFCSEFQRLFDAPLCFVLIFGFLTMALVSFFIMLEEFQSLGLWIFEGKMLLDLVLLTVSIQGVGNSSRVVRRLSLENYYVTERSDWHTMFEMFFSRLNYHQFRVRPLGLFDVSNELILVFLSALVTYLTYIVQSKQF